MQFDTIQGQKKAKKILTRTLASGRLGHAFLFVGPEGVGKVSMGRRFANILFCSSAIKPCLQCPQCSKFSSGNHPDFIHVQPEGVSIKINQIRALKQAVTFAPFEQGYRVLILEDVHLLRKEAGNSLLKLLEEPPADNILILTGNSLEAILPTIVSRCQVIPFSSLSEEITADILLQEKPELDKEHAALLAAVTEGSPGKAMALETEGIFEAYNQCIDRVLNASSDRSIQVEQALAFALEIIEFKDNLFTLLHLFRVFFKNVLLSTVQPQGVMLRSDQISKARELWSFEQLSDKIEAVNYAERALNSNCNKGLVCEVLMLNLIQR